MESHSFNSEFSPSLSHPQISNGVDASQSLRSATNAQPKGGLALGRVGLQVGIVFLALLWLVILGSTWSQAADENAEVPETSGANDGYSFKWLDPEKKIYVLQNRRYTKANKLTLSFLAGPGFSNPYRSTFSIEPRASFYLTETWGFEVFYDKTFNSSNNTLQALQATNTNTFPIIRQIQSEFGILAHWAPFYAKINVFNQILYFDWYFEGGLGSLTSGVTTSKDTTNYSNQSETAFFLGTGHQFHVNDRFTVRLDFMGTYYQAPLQGTTGSNVWFTNYNFTLGLGMHL